MNGTDPGALSHPSSEAVRVVAVGRVNPAAYAPNSLIVAFPCKQTNATRNNYALGNGNGACGIGASGSVRSSTSKASWRTWLLAIS